MKASLKRQRGITLTRLIVVGLLLVLVVIGAMRILPDVTDYYTILKDAKATASAQWARIFAWSIP